MGRGDTVIEGVASLFGFAQHAAHPRVGVLNVVNRVVVRLRAGEVDVKGQLRIGAARRQEEARGIAADFVDQVAHGDVAARPLRELHLDP